MNKPTTDAKEILRRIDRFLDEGKTIEELKHDLREKGIDPDEMLRKIKERLAPLYKFKEEGDGMDKR